MSISIPKASAPIRIQRVSAKNWLAGTVTAFDDGRTPPNGLRASGNVILDQDGTIRPRQSLVLYGTQPTGTVLGEIHEFVKTVSNVNYNYLLMMQNVAGVTNVYYALDGGAWTLATGKTYDNSAKAHFVQVDNKVLIQNGVDNLSYFDITSLVVVPFTALGAASVTSAVATVIGGATFTYYYKVSANSTVGETAASAATSVGVTKLREQWISATEFVTVTWPAVTNAKSYNVYVSITDPAAGGTAYLLASGVNGLSYKDIGSTAYDVSTPAPTFDSTAGPICTRASVINGQVFLVGDKNNPDYVRYGGTGASTLDFSPYNGGGWSELGRGTKEFPVKVMSFRDGRGNSQISVLARGTNGTGKRYIMSPSSVTIGTTIINFFDVTEDNGQDGTDSPDAVVLYRDSLWYPSRDGFKTTGTKPQLQNILSTDTVSETILGDIKNLNSLYMPGAVGLAREGRIYFAVPNGATYNNEIWVLDLIRGGAWMKPWSIRADWMVQYNDNSGVSHHLVLSNNALYELTYAQATNDNGTAFSTNISSGLIKFSEDTLEWAKVIDITFILLRPTGVINLTVSGKTEDSSLATVGQGSFTTTSTVAGWGEAGWGGSPDLAKPKIFGWSNFSVIPIAFGASQTAIVVEVDEEVEWLQWELDTANSQVDYQLADAVIRFVPIGTKDLS